jgi:hypothetical protein
MAGTTRHSPVYRNVAALLISWHEDNDDLKVSEEASTMISLKQLQSLTARQVNRLKHIFEKKYRFKASNVRLTCGDGPRPQVQLNKAVADFVSNEDKEHTLLIIYYAGHGLPGPSPGHLQMSG